jgi:hypothetical protein
MGSRIGPAAAAKNQAPLPYIQPRGLVTTLTETQGPHSSLG